MNSYWDNFKDIHRYGTCLVIGNGLSLNHIPKKLLRKYFSFGTNRIFLMKDFVPTYYVAVNALKIVQNQEEIQNICAKKKFIEFPLNLLFPQSIPIHSILPFPSKNPGHGICQGSTVTNVCLQIAYWMGFSTVLLIGIDHRYNTVGIANEIMTKDPKAMDHFYFDRIEENVPWQYPDLKNSELYYGLVKTMYEKDSRTIINITPNSALDIFEKQKYRDWI